MEPLAQLEGEQTWLEADLLRIQRALDDQQRHPQPEAADAQNEVVRLLTIGLRDCLARLDVVNERLAEMRGAQPRSSP
jgi:hypothetical protein